MAEALTNETVGPRTAMAREAFFKHFRRMPDAEISDTSWLVGYVAALEDLPDEMLSALRQVSDAG